MAKAIDRPNNQRKSPKKPETKPLPEHPGPALQAPGAEIALLGDDRLMNAQRSPVVERMGQVLGNQRLQRWLNRSTLQRDDNFESPHPTVRQGSSGDSVNEAQEKLNRAGAEPALEVDGIFGPLTDQATRQFQGAHPPLETDGIIGPLTWGELHHARGTGTTTTVPPETAARWDETDRTRLAGQTSGTGALNAFQAGRVEPRVNAVSDAEWSQFHSLLESAGSDLEWAFLCKAFAAQRAISDITPFAERIRGMSERWLMRNLMAVNLGTNDDATVDPEERGIQQQYGNSCGPTSVQLLHAQADPIYALELRSGGPIDVATEHAMTDPSSVQNPTLANEQRDMLATHHAAGTGNEATDRSNPTGGAWVESDMNALASATGVTYTNRMIGTAYPMETALTTLRTSVTSGIQVPITVGGQLNETAHYVVVINISGTRFLIHDVWAGESVWRSEDDFRNHTLNLPSGWNWMTSIDVPTTTPPPLPAPPTPAP